MPVKSEYLPATAGGQQELVLLHGWGCNREIWRPLLVLLRPWANITLLDVPGCAPIADAGSAPALPDVLAAILDCSPGRAVYVGWSLGGQLALEIAATYPERVAALVTICSNPRFVAGRDWPGLGEEVFGAFRVGFESDPASAMRRFNRLQAMGSVQPAVLVRQIPYAGPPSPALRVGLNWLAELDQRASLAALKPPQLHLLAERDALVPCSVTGAIEKQLAHVTSGYARVLEGACHLAPLHVPVQLAGHIGSFLEATGTLCPHLPPDHALEKKAVAASFSRAAASYDSVAHLQQEVGTQLLGYLDRTGAAPAIVLDLGCGTGHFCLALKQRYPGAQYVGLDIAPGMVGYARPRNSGDCAWLVGDAEALPLASESVDVVFSNLALQWCYRLEHLFGELARILRPGGLCVFTSLGPHTLCELRAAWATVDSHQHVNRFLSTAELAAAAERIHGIEVGLERRVLCLEYARVRDLLDELKALGAHNMNRSRGAGLTTRRGLQGMVRAYESHRAGGTLPATYEVIFGVVEKV
ncbi:MAG: malonyl-ACP O-methyltransferase BioC [Halioglobus sp.]